MSPWSVSESTPFAHSMQSPTVAALRQCCSANVTVETDGGTYAEWHIGVLDVGKTRPLELQYPTKTMRGVRSTGKSTTFRVRIRSAPPDSEEAEAWRSGAFPAPEYSQ